MPKVKQPKYDEVLEGIRVRTFVVGREYVVVFHDDDVDDPKARAMCYPKMGDPEKAPAAWAAQGRLDYDRNFAD